VTTDDVRMLANHLGMFPNPNNGGAGFSVPTRISPPSMSSSPSNSPNAITNPDLYRILNEVVPLDECEVYSWFPEPEYDPHIQAEDGEASEDGFELNEEEEVLIGDGRLDGMDVDQENPANWGQAGMELDDVSASVPMARTRSRSGKAEQTSGDALVGSSDEDWEGGRGSRSGGLLWSANYFFYSK